MFSTRDRSENSKRGFWGLLLVTLVAVLSAAWESQQSPFGTVVTNGSISFTAPDAKAGENMAEILNEADKKSEKQEKKNDKKDDRKK
ncbi:MAG: hypothetical protein ACOYZ8_10440 [Chloroflexota bacterium]